MNKLSVKQNGFRDCASACLLSIIKYYGGYVSKEEISYLIKTDKYGTNAYNLIEGARKIGFDGYGVKIPFEEINNYNNLPAIAHTNVSNMYHYIVLYEINKKYIKIMDPQYGIKKVSYKYFKSIYLGTLLYLYPVKKIPNITVKDKIYSYIFQIFITNKPKISLLLFLSIVVTLFNIISNLYLKIYIDYVYPNFSIKLLCLISLVFIVVMFFKSIFENIRNKLLINFKLMISKNITNMSFSHIMNLPYHYIKNKPTGEISSRISNLEYFKDLVSTLMLNIFANIFLVLISMIILIILNKSLFFLSIITLIFYIIVVYIYSIIFKNKISDLQISDGDYYKNLIETLNGYESIKNLNIVNDSTNRVNMKYSKYLNNLKSFEYSYTNERSIKDIINDLSMIFISIISLLSINRGLMSFGDLVMFSSLILFFSEPIKELLNLIPNIRYATNSYERINDLLMIEKEKTNNMSDEIIDGDITVKNLSYSYNGSDDTFKNINLNIKKGEKILIYGKSGSGKSTLGKILLKYLTDYKGKIKINNINLKDINLDILRNSLCYISQNEVLFSDTIKNNIILNRNVTEEEYNEIINICNVEKIIDKKPFRNEFILEEDGFNLSGGERQKIILARGLLKKFNILILDEVLSEISFKEELEIMERIFKKYNSKTIIYISHKEEMISEFKNKFLFEKKGEEDA